MLFVDGVCLPLHLLRMRFFLIQAVYVTTNMFIHIYFPCQAPVFGIMGSAGCSLRDSGFVTMTS